MQDILFGLELSRKNSSVTTAFVPLVTTNVALVALILQSCYFVAIVWFCFNEDEDLFPSLFGFFCVLQKMLNHPFKKDKLEVVKQ